MPPLTSQHPSNIPPLLLYLSSCVCASGRAVLVCVDVLRVLVDACGTINLRFAGGRESRCMWLLCTTPWNGLCCCLTRSLIQHPHWFVCRSAVNTPASLSLSLSPPGNFPSCPGLTDRLSDFQLPLCYAVLAEFLPSSSLSRQSVWCCSSSPATLPFLLQRRCVSRRWDSSACEYLCSRAPLFSFPSVWSQSELWRCNLCQRLPESSFLSTLTFSSLSLTHSALTGSTIQVTHGCKHPVALLEELLPAQSYEKQYLLWS